MQTINTSFSKLLPTLQLAWDSTSLGALKTCPAYYNYAIRQGYVPRITKVALKWGLEYHASLEAYDRALTKGQTHREAVHSAVRRALIGTWDFKTNRPWVSDEPTKTRETLIRSIVWYLIQFENDPIKTVIFSDGTPAVEKSFSFDPGILSLSTGENFIICGHLDRIGVLNKRMWILDRKTTKGSIGPNYFEQYTPDNQMSLYDFGGHVVYFQDLAGIIIDAAQTGVNFTRFQRGQITRTPAQRDDWLRDTQTWLRIAESYAKQGHWPQNDKACNMYGSYQADRDEWKNGCPYRPVCSSEPNMRPKVLEALYEKRIWDPLITREV